MSGWPEARLRETSRVVVKYVHLSDMTVNLLEYSRTLRPIQDFVQGYMGKGAVLRAIAISDRRKIKGYLKKLAKLRERLMASLSDGASLTYGLMLSSTNHFFKCQPRAETKWIKCSRPMSLRRR